LKMTVDPGVGLLRDVAGEQQLSASVTMTRTPHFPAPTRLISRLSQCTLQDIYQMRITWTLS
jgi:hypothetical protein